MARKFRFPIFWETGRFSDEEKKDLVSGADASLDEGSILLLILEELREINAKLDQRS